MPMGQMSQMMSDAVPEGMKRVGVELDLQAGDQEMDFPAEQITLEAGGETFSPYGALLADESLAPGSAPQRHRHLRGAVGTGTATFRLNGDAPAVTVDVSKGPGRPAGDHPRARELTDSDVGRERSDLPRTGCVRAAGAYGT